MLVPREGKQLVRPGRLGKEAEPTPRRLLPLVRKPAASSPGLRPDRTLAIRSPGFLYGFGSMIRVESSRSGPRRFEFIAEAGRAPNRYRQNRHQGLREPVPGGTARAIPQRGSPARSRRRRSQRLPGDRDRSRVEGDKRAEAAGREGTSRMLRSITPKQVILRNDITPGLRGVMVRARPKSGPGVGFGPR